MRFRERSITNVPLGFKSLENLPFDLMLEVLEHFDAADGGSSSSGSH